MLYKVDHVQFNCDDDIYDIKITEQCLSDRYQSTIWDVDTDEDITEIMEDAIGYPIVDINYHSI